MFIRTHSNPSSLCEVGDEDKSTGSNPWPGDSSAETAHRRMKLCTFAYMLVLTLVLSASFATQSPVPCAACKHETAMLIPNLPSTIRAACGKPLPGGGTCQVERRKNFYKCKRPECGQYSRGNATSKVEDCIHRHKEHIQGPFENPTVLSSLHRKTRP
ncbi:hypothetical protein PTTG_28941 [Puccinia triticina 1-1 BBBD Race 1]|uniref:Uncharacterized protein n=1 Tax=Puccinia triticina (isolate 1-1 / race 1 (BBBD)) TaxID=630390 RepID=A0A180G7Q7_PUCT1|nr:hypothetical protein PTTG_28941 [Puccinia triticina 1-1 BBBD Race 1]